MKVMETVVLQPESSFELLLIKEFLEKTHIKNKFLSDEETGDFAEDLKAPGESESISTGLWDDEDFVKEIDEAYCRWETGQEKGYTLAEADTLIDELRQKRKDALR